MRLPNGTLQRTKNGLHALQAIIIFLSWAITIGIFTKSGTVDGRIDYFFALCWLCLPALIYQCAVPIFQRTQRFANPYAFAIIDIVFAIFWFAAFISVATWVSSGIKKGEADNKDAKDMTGCEIFGFGSPEKCKLGQVNVGMGVVVFILWVATSAISIYGVIHYRKNGFLPGTTPRIQDPNSIESQTKTAFSSNPQDNFDADEELGLGPDRNEDDEYALLHTDTTEGTHPGRPLSWGRESASGENRYDTSYQGGGAYNPEPEPRAANPFNASHELPEIQAGDPFRDDLGLSHEHGDYDSGGIVPFPSADYHR